MESEFFNKWMLSALVQFDDLQSTVYKLKYSGSLDSVNAEQNTYAQCHSNLKCPQ